jgi:hypothetical protein
MLPMLIGASGAYVVAGLVLLFTYPLFALAVPAAFVENLGFKESIARSITLGKANYGNLLLFSLVAGILNYVGMTCCCLPFLFVYPWITIAFLLIYRDVSNLPLVSEFENASQTPYPREYGMTMPNFDATQSEIPRSDTPPVAPAEPPTDQTPG